MTNKVYPIKIQGDKNTLIVYWQLTDFCNYKCSYCPEFLHAGTYATKKLQGFPTDEEIFKFLSDLKTKHLKGRKLWLILSGGEPILHPLFPEIVNQLVSYGKICITTNGSRSLNWWKGLEHLPQEFTISLHPEFTKIDKINELSNYLLEKDVDLFFNLSCDQLRWEEVKALYNNLDDHLKNKVWPKVLNNLHIDTSPMFNLDKDQSEWITEINRTTYLNIRNRTEQNPYKVIYSNGKDEPVNIAKLISQELNMFKNWKCSAGHDGIKVNFDGFVYAGICRHECLGRLDNFELLSEYVTCKFDYCGCNGDLRIDKYSQAL